MPERGGPTTQSGIYYQNSVAALYLGRLCDATQRPDSQRVVRVRVEAPTSVDDTVVTFADGGVTYIQAKENIRDSDASWADLWSDFETQFRRPEFSRGRDRLLLHTGEHHKEHHALRELCDRTVGSRAPSEWASRLKPAQNSVLKKIKPHLSPELSGDADMLLEFFRHVDVEIASLTQVERDMAPRWMPASNEPPAKLFSLLRDRVGKAARRREEFTEEALRASLKAKDKIILYTQPAIDELRALIRECGAMLRQHKHTFGNTGRHVERPVAADITKWALESGREENLALLLDQAGMGKTIVLRDVLLALEGTGAAVLAIKADQQLSGIESPEDLRASLRLPDSIERVVSRLAEAGDVVVMVDQLDALSLSMAHDQKALNVVLDLVARLRLIGGVRILVSCRTFDLNNDPSLRRLGVNKRFSIPELTEEEVRLVFEGSGGDFERLSPATQKLLRIPLHLDLFALAMESDERGRVQSVAHGILSLQDLYALLWRNVVRKPDADAPPISSRERVLSLLTEYMNREQRTSAPQSVVTGTGDRELEKAATWLASEGILIPGTIEWSYLHQTFFDYCYAKEFAERGHSLSETVVSGDQGIFARPQIVQVLGYLRGVSRQAYLRELNALLTAEPLRAHLKDLVFSWFGALPNPTDEEWLYARRMLADVKRRGRLLAAMAANPGWFAYLKDATIPSLLGREDETLDSLVIPYLISMLGAEQAEVIKLVSPYLSRGERWNRRLNWILRNVRQWKTREAIDLFEQMFGPLSSAEIKHLYQLDNVTKADPRVGCRLARIAFDKVLDDNLAARKGDERAYLFSLSSYLEQYNGSTMSKTLQTIAQEEPEYFLEQMLPWLASLGVVSNDLADLVINLPLFEQLSYLSAQLVEPFIPGHVQLIVLTAHNSLLRPIRSAPCTYYSSPFAPDIGCGNKICPHNSTSLPILGESLNCSRK